ncbi:MAG: hypothetical protein U0075_18485 [Thermomicrobiales bacterium]
MLGGLETLCIAIGDHLGLYAALQQIGPATARDLAAYAETDERYTREWLEQQAMATILSCENPGSSPGGAPLFAPCWVRSRADRAGELDWDGADGSAFAGVAAPFAQLLAAFRTGAGVPYADYGEHMHIGQARSNRANFTHLLAQEWIAAMPDIAARLHATSGPHCRHRRGPGVVERRPGTGLSRARVDGLDLDPASIAAAGENAVAVGLLCRTRGVPPAGRRRSGAGRPVRPRARHRVHPTCLARWRCSRPCANSWDRAGRC